MSKVEPTYDCFHDKPAVEPNGDISGPGVLTGFLGTTYLAILVLVGYYLFAFDPTKNPYAQSKGGTMRGTGDSPVEMDTLAVSQAEDSAAGETNTHTSQEHGAAQLDNDAQMLSPPQAVRQDDDWVPNPVDVMFLAGVRGFFGIRQFEAEESADQAQVERIFINCMRSLCDAQLMTGVGILLSAYCTLYAPDGGGGITAYHWQIAVYLSWMSNLTYFTGMTFLRKYLNQSRNTVELWWRTIAMSVLFLLVFVALQPLVYFNWNIPDIKSEAQPAAASSFAFCFFRLSDVEARMADQKNGFEVPFSSASSAILSMCLLAFSFASRIVKLTSPWARFFRVKVRRRLSDYYKRHAEMQFQGVNAPLGRLYANLHTKTLSEVRRLLHAEMQGADDHLAASSLTGRLYADLHTSMLSEVYWAIVAAIWATIRLFESRKSADVDENEFTFGQILAMFLLALPIITISFALWPLRSKLLPSMLSQKPGPEDRPSPSHLHSRRRHNVLAEVCHEPLSDKKKIRDTLIDGARSYSGPMSGLILTCLCLQALVTTAHYFWIITAQRFNSSMAALETGALFLHQLHACNGAYGAILDNARRHPTIFLSGTRGTEDLLDTTNMAEAALSKAKAALFLLRIDCMMPFAVSITMTMIWTAIMPSVASTGKFICIRCVLIGWMAFYILSLDYLLGRYLRRRLYHWHGSSRSRHV